MFRKYYYIKQKELKDCGCACLATICKQYGLKVPIYKIKELAKTDKMGTSAKGIIESANSLRFVSKAFRANNKEKIYNDILVSAIAHVIMNKSYEHIINLPMSFFQTRTVGKVISRLDDAYKIRSVILGATLTVMIDGFMAIR